MARLIDAEALERSFRDVMLDDVPTYLNVIVGMIRSMPTVKAEPVRHGRWVDFPECLKCDGAYCQLHIVCSVCGDVWSIMDNDADRFDYCPHCGARMDGEAGTHEGN